MHLGSRTFAKAALKFMLIKFLFCVCVERLEACRGRARQSYCRFFIFLFFISLFFVQTAEPEAELSKILPRHAAAFCLVQPGFIQVAKIFEVNQKTVLLFFFLLYKLDVTSFTVCV